ncbi:MAG TPA: hypothetical protein VFE50_13915 [Cyclobacteriaceae bacterium]|nr:hypothetical protein [Cyclobacteriaceae bacterium]
MYNIKRTEMMMNTTTHHEKPGIDYILILVPLIYLVILIIEGLSK